jgi:hypothetical protein
MKFLSLLVEGSIVDQIETTLTSEQIIEIDEFLRKNDNLYDNEELALTEDLLDK